MILGSAPDPYDLRTASGWFCYDSLFMPDFTLDPEIKKVTGVFNDPEYMRGLLAESWEMTDPTTMTVKLREGIKWHDISPLNGREFVASDVKYNYDRLIGLGDFTEGAPMYVGAYPSIQEVVVINDYTVAFKFKNATALSVYEVINGGGFAGWQALSAPEVAEQQLNKEWETATIGTGPYMFDEYLAGTSLSYKANPNYFGTDERHPGNKLPYVDKVKIIQIPDMSTSIAALRTGKVDLIADGRNYPSIQDITTLNKTNPEIQTGYWPVAGYGLEFRCDLEPFSDIRVRKALQMAIDRKLIAESYFEGTVDGTPCGMIAPTDIGWCLPYAEWPDDLKAEYTYNPNKAMELLAEAGYPDGFSCDCLISARDDATLLTVLQAELKDIKIDMDINVMEHSAAIAYAKEFKHQYMRIQVAAGGAFGPISSLSSRISTNSNNVTKNNDATYDEMYNQLSEITDLDDAQKLSQEMELYALKQHWTAYLFPAKANIVWQEYLKGYNAEYTAVGGPLFARLWLDK